MVPIVNPYTFIRYCMYEKYNLFCNTKHNDVVKEIFDEDRFNDSVSAIMDGPMAQHE